MVTELTHLTTNITDLSQLEYYFPDDFLSGLGFSKQHHFWDDEKPFHTLSSESGFEIHVVGNSEVWIERYGKLSHLTGVRICQDLIDLERILS